MEPLRGRVQRVQKVQRVQRGRYRLTAMSFICCLAAAKTKQPRFARWKCTPIPACGGTSPKGKHVTGFSVAQGLPTNPVPLPPRRGKFALCPAFELISISKHSAAKTSPSGGGAVGRRGAFPRAIGAVVWFSLARKGGCKGFIHNGGGAAHLHPRVCQVLCVNFFC